MITIWRDFKSKPRLRTGNISYHGVNGFHSLCSNCVVHCTNGCLQRASCNPLADFNGP